MVKLNDFAVFIITHGRPYNQTTYETLRNAKYTGKVYFIVDDEDSTIADYQRVYGAKNVKVFHKENNFDLGDCESGYKAVPVYARNECFRIAKELGIKYFVELDDDYSRIAYRYVRGNSLTSRAVKYITPLFLATCEMLDLENVYCIAYGVPGDYIGGALGKHSKGLIQNARNSFFCRTDKPFEFLGRINEDVTTPAFNNNLGKLFFTTLDVQVDIQDHATNTGGSSKQYKQTNLYWNYFYPILWLPSAITIGSFKNKLIKHIEWDCLLPKIISDKYRREK